MSLRKGYSYKTVSLNIAQMKREGYAHEQAVAASLKQARHDFFKRYPQGALPVYLVPKNGKRLKNPCACAERKPNPVPASKHVQIRNASELYQNFTGHEATDSVEVDKPVLPDVMLVVGDIDGVLYSTVRDGVEEKYIHKFKKKCRPLFCVSHDGKQLFMLGGSYDFTECGIVDRT